MATTVPEAQCKECFDLFDTDSDGKIKASELGDALRSLGLVMTQKEVKELGKEVMGDALSWDKFKELAAKVPLKSEKQSAALTQAFQVFDKGSTGMVDMAELKHIVTSMGEKLTPQEFEDICKVAGLPAAGSVEYKQVVQQVVKPIREDPVDASASWQPYPAPVRGGGASAVRTPGPEKEAREVGGGRSAGG
eukprot:CAMPEP_0171194208 /NCGR_PEP_ID=MMETSP0790-20130122/20772_1 /TAXON_ID=2925 /ORGANISM="Alexandrium catenella, Strain OF101" /LENGTH=191 /DNA_ID=CAMNT_0011659401 /DNA_START=78 /DNA_END=650 /DNA_ORIENTATION=+